MNLRTAAQRALEALQTCTWDGSGWQPVQQFYDEEKVGAAIKALRVALAQQAEPDDPERRCGGPGCNGECCQRVAEPVAQQAEPVAGANSMTEKRTVWVAYTNTDCTEGRGHDVPIAVCAADTPVVPLYTATSRIRRKPLTEEEIISLLPSGIRFWETSPKWGITVARAVERAHGVGEKE